MSLRRSGILGLVLAGAMIAPASAFAGPTLISIAPTGHLGLEGASATIAVTYSCELGATSDFLTVVLSQSTGNRLAQAFGSPPTVICDGTAQTTDVTVDASGIPLKQGKAVVTATLTDYVTSASSSLSQGVTLKKK